MKQLEQKDVFWLSGIRLRPGDRANPDSYKVRRAKVGGWRDYFDDQESAAIDATLAARPLPLFGYGVAQAVERSA
jgi:alcohol sulfotransferase